MFFCELFNVTCEAMIFFLEGYGVITLVIRGLPREVIFLNKKFPLSWFKMQHSIREINPAPMVIAQSAALKIQKNNCQIKLRQLITITA